MHKGHKYATCVMDIDTGEVLWVGKGRSIKDFSLFFEQIDMDYLSDVKAVAMDMNGAFNKLVARHLSHATIVYDRYHMQSQFGRNVLGAVRLEEARIHKEEGLRLKDKATYEIDRNIRREIKNTGRSEMLSYRS